MVQILIGTKSSHDFFDADTYELFVRCGEIITPRMWQTIYETVENRYLLK